MKNISFIIPAYNCQETLEESVDSIFNENFIPGDEVIIVNDCSTDSTSKIITKVCNKYQPNIKSITNEENKGCPASRNIGIKASKNDLILSLDSDNVLLKNSINGLREKLEEMDADIITFGEVLFFPKNTDKITHKWIFKKGWFILADLFAGNFNPGPIGNYMFTKKSWEKVGGFSELGKGLHEAWIFTFKQLLLESKMFIDNKGFYFHRYGHPSLTIREYSKNNVEEQILKSVLSNNMDIFEEEDRKYIEQNTPMWINKLNKKPIKLKLVNVGKNGKLHRTIYGICRSILKKINL